LIVDLWLVYQFIKRLTTPFKKWEAFKLGIIDENGNILKKRKDFTTASERKAFGIFDLMILKIKKLLAKIPGGSSTIASYAAALYLIREWKHFSDSSLLTEDIPDETIEESIKLFHDKYVNYIILQEVVNKKIYEDAPTVNVGSGEIAGLGFGPQGEPGFTASQMKKYKKKAKTIKRLRDIIGNNS
jgi:hypothetical protein